MKLWFLIVCWSIIPMLQVRISYGQQRTYNLINFSTTSGLPSNEVRGLAVDSQGSVWISTNKGLAFYDGKQVHNIPFNQANAGFTNDLGKIAIDGKQRVWIATDNQGLLCYDKRKPLATSITYYPVRVDRKILQNELYEVFASKSGLIYFGGQETELQVLDPGTGKMKRIVFPVKNKKTALSIYSITEDSRGLLWIGSRYEGFFSYDPHHNTVESFNLNQPDENAVSSFIFRNQDVFTMYYDNDLVQYNTISKTLRIKLLAEQKSKEFYDNTYSAMVYDSNKDEIIAGHVSKGIVIYQPATGIYQHVNWKELCPKCELPIKVNVMLKTAKGYWIGTSAGLFLYEDAMNKINQLILADQDPIIQVFKVGHEIWYRTVNSFGKLSPDLKQKLSTYSLHAVKMSQVNIIDKRIYFSSYYNGLFYFDTEQQLPLRPLPISGNHYGFHSADCNTVLQDAIDGKPILWIGTWNKGLYRYDLSNNTITCYDRNKGLPSNKIVNLGRDGKQGIWLGLDGNGLLQILNKKRFIWRQFIQQKEGEQIPSNKVVNFSKNNLDTMWFSTGSSGLCALTQNREKVSIQYFKDNNSFPHNFINDIKRDKYGRLWLRSNDGFMVFEPRTKTFIQLLNGRGIIPSLPIKTYDLSFIDDHLVLSTDKGILRANINTVDFSRSISEMPIFSKFSIANKDHSYLLFDRPYVQLHPNENNFSIHFSHPEALLREYIFAYRLQGVDHDWIVTKEDFQAVYNNLQGGDYIFEVKLGDKYGLWSTQVATLNIHLQSQWYQTIWFKVAVFVIGIGAVLGLFLYRLRQQQRINHLQLVYTDKLQDELLANELKIKEQAKILEIEKSEKLEADFRKKLMESELKAIRSQMNPHFIFNVFNSIEAYVMENDSKSASMLIQKFATLSRIVLENSQFSLVGIPSELHLIRLYLELEQDRFAHIFSFQIHTDPQLDIHNKKIPSMLIQPIVENAVHHGIRHLVDRPGKIKINLIADRDCIIIEVMDNGIGFKEQELKTNRSFKGTSFGLKGVQNRLDLINDKFSISIASLAVLSLSDGDEFRTKVVIRLPSIDDKEKDTDA